MRLYTAPAKGVFAIREKPPASAGFLQRFAYVVRSLFGLKGGRCWKLSFNDGIDVYKDAMSSGSGIRHGNGKGAAAPEAAGEPDVQAVPSHQLSGRRPDEPVDGVPDEAASTQIGAQPQPAVGEGPQCARRDRSVVAARQPSPGSRTARRIAMPPALPFRFPPGPQPGAEPATAPLAEAAALQTTEVGMPGAGMATEAPNEIMLKFASRVRRSSADALRQVVDTLNSAADKGKRAILGAAASGEAGPSETPEARRSIASGAIDPAAPPVEIMRMVRRRPLEDYEAALQRAITHAGDDATTAANLQGCIASLKACPPNVMSAARIGLLKSMARWMSKPRELQSPALLRLAGSVLEQGLGFGKDEDDSTFALSLKTLPTRWAKEAKEAPELALALAIHLPRLPQQSRVDLTGSLLEILVKTPPPVADSIRTLLGAYSAGSARAFTEMVEHVASLPAGYRPLLLAAMASTLGERPLLERSGCGIALLRACVALPLAGEGSRQAEGPGSMASIVGRVVEALPAIHGFARDTALINTIEELGKGLPQEERRQFRTALWDALVSAEAGADTAADPAADPADDTVARTAPGTAPN